MAEAQENLKNEGVHLMYKNLGETPNKTILRFKAENPEFNDVKMTYAGRLDPMAEGLLLVLAGDKVHEKDKYLGLSKVYEFEILWGVETDTLDVLGKVTHTNNVDISEEEIVKKISESQGKILQKYPAYSSKPVNGKPLFEWAREGKMDEVEVPTHEVEIRDIKYLSRRMMKGEKLLQDMCSKISLVKGDFRQQEIKDVWKDFLETENKKDFFVDKISVNVSSGFYIRQFISDFASDLGTYGIAFHIKRVKIGDFEIELSAYL